ncbi:MAG: exosortase/archaeosortase family protein [Desulfobacterales bacterium]|nr:exosortase/archaeosortase family protein [Desulfobacterales bacterium]
MREKFLNICRSPAVFQTILILAGFVFLYTKAIQALISDWSADPNFSHGFLIPPIALYMVWFNKDRLVNTAVKPSNWGLGVILAGMVIHLLGHAGAELFLMRFSMIVTLAGIVIFLLGWSFLRAMAVPLFYLIMMIPIPAIIWNKIAFPLQLMAAQLSAELIQFIQIPVFREGNILHLANTSLEVVDACSGLRSLTSLIALTGIFAYLAPFTIVKKWILFLSAVPIAVAVNVIRLTITAAMAFYIGPDTAHGFLHDMSGLIIFAGALALVYLVFNIEMAIERRQRKK